MSKLVIRNGWAIEFVGGEDGEYRGSDLIGPIYLEPCNCDCACGCKALTVHGTCNLCKDGAHAP